MIFHIFIESELYILPYENGLNLYQKTTLKRVTVMIMIPSKNSYNNNILMFMCKNFIQYITCHFYYINHTIYLT